MTTRQMVREDQQNREHLRSIARDDTGTPEEREALERLYERNWVLIHTGRSPTGFLDHHSAVKKVEREAWRILGRQRRGMLSAAYLAVARRLPMPRTTQSQVYEVSPVNWQRYGF